MNLGLNLIFLPFLIILMCITVVVVVTGIVFLFINAERRQQGTKMIIGAVIVFIVSMLMYLNLVF